jgi:hypothetical protein
MPNGITGQRIVMLALGGLNMSPVIGKHLICQQYHHKLSVVMHGNDQVFREAL